MNNHLEGGKKAQGASGFTWNDETSFDQAFWAKNYPSAEEGERCVAMQVDSDGENSGVGFIFST